MTVCFENHEVSPSILSYSFIHFSRASTDILLNRCFEAYLLVSSISHACRFTKTNFYSLK
jgi:hypothetical protein